MRCSDEFERIYHRSPDDETFTPYRVCPIGAHIDHQFGKITGLAIDKGIRLSYCAAEDGTIELTSLQFDKRTSFTIRDVPKHKQNDWADYLRGATVSLGKRYPLSVGLVGVIDGEMPIGGLSSSAAVVITFMSALCRLNHIDIPQQELILAAKEAENEYVGVSCGKLDQSCEVYSKKDHLLFMDMKDDSYELIPQHKSMKPYRIAILFSGLERTLVGSKYGMRIDECRAAAYALMAYAGAEYGKFSETVLRDVPREWYDTYKDRLPETWRRRAEHWYTESERVEEGAAAWRRGDLDTFGRLIFESGRSSVENYEVGSKELITLYDIMTKTDGIYGGRFSGAGFKGCCMALVDPDYCESITEKVTKAYLTAFPELTGKFAIRYCQSADGVKI